MVTTNKISLGMAKTRVKSQTKMDIVTVLDLPNKFVFSVKPKGAKEPPIDPWVAVDKKTGKVSGFSPMQDIENFKKALQGGSK